MLVSKLARMTVSWLAVTAMTAATAGLVLSSEARAATTPYQTTGRLNVRTGPSTSQTILTTLDKGAVVLATGSVSKDWLPISFSGTTAYVFADYVKKTTSTTPATVGLAGKKTTTANVNERTAAALTSTVVKVIKKGTTVSVTGRVSGDFTEIKDGSAIRWLYTQYVSQDVDPTPDPSPAPPSDDDPVTSDDTGVATATTTTLLTLRESALSTSTSLGNVPQGATVTLTGKHTGTYSQVVYNKVTGWILTGYFKVKADSTSGIVSTTIPVATGKVWVNATGVNMRTDSNVESAKVTVLSYATELSTTGVTKNKYTTVIYDGTIRWVYDQYLSRTAIDPTKDLGSTSLNKLEKYGKAAVVEVRENFPQIVTIGGWRSGSKYSSDHPNGRAIDIMIPNYKSNKALGDKIADWVIKNGNRLHVTYLIWYQRNYRLSRGSWVKMANRGSDNQNHKNHVHVSFYAS